MNEPPFAEGEDVEVTIKGKVLWVGDSMFEIDEWMFSLADLHHPGFSLKPTIR